MSTEFVPGSVVLAAWHEYRLSILLVFSVLTIIVFSKSFSKSKHEILAQPIEITGPLSVGKQSGEIRHRDINEKQSSLSLESQRRPATTTQAAKAVTRKVSGSGKGSSIKPVVFYATLTGSTETSAKAFVERLNQTFSDSPDVLDGEAIDISAIDLEDYFVTHPEANQKDVNALYLILLPTYNIDTIVDTFIEHLRETHHDFRIDTSPLSSIAGYSVFGFGDKQEWPTEAEGYCSQALEVDKWMAKLSGRKRAFPLGTGDVKSNARDRLDEWRQGVEAVITSILTEGGLGEGVAGSGDPIETDDEEDFSTGDEGESKLKSRRKKKASTLADVEDIGRERNGPPAVRKIKSKAGPPVPIDFTTSSPSSVLPDVNIKEMVPKSSPTYASLTKQGYTIIGSHSGVKICRWTKSALRGRGSCYKHSFYGIASHLCMETTPSLSCSNKCVFCWRHGTNPVGTTWRWQVDPPDLIFKGAVEGHLKKIKVMRGVPGVRAERFQEAMRIRHCALSLVGEPIFYPHINEFVGLLHSNHISSFLVCNAQHPEQLAKLRQVTQLYVSIDASNKEALRKIDRPLHRDFWERFVRCLDILKERRREMRTVYRLTLVKGFNIDEEAEGYAELVARGLPCFVEIKGVTYCGTSTSGSAGLTMANVPFWEEVQEFVVALNKALERKGLDYGLAAEHAHSCCALLASKRFNIDGQWHTLIDYDRFFELVDSGADFGPEDYVGKPTPEWALWGRGGFDPRDVRVDRKGRKIEA